MTFWTRIEHQGRARIGTVEGDTIRLHEGDMFAGAVPTTETVAVAEARWLSRDELRPENLPKDGSFFMPRRDSIARRLIEEWLGHEAGPSISG